tara:strand:- start:39 stop:323 length:285 start_codon:yes stop_codon:yes gene_type:complete
VNITLKKKVILNRMFENWPNENSLIHDPIVGYLIFIALIIIPLYRLAKRFGLPVWTVLFAFVPYVGLVITTGFFAHMKWTNFEEVLSKKNEDDE